MGSDSGRCVGGRVVDMDDANVGVSRSTGC